MKLFLKIIKILLATVFTVYIGLIAYQLVFQSKEKRFNIAGNMQGHGWSQTMFGILNWQHPDYAAAFFERLDALTPDVVDAPWGEDIDFLRGECYYGLGNYPKALEHFEQSVINQGADWVDVQAFVYQGLCHYEMGNYDDAIVSFENGLEQYETTCEAYFGLAKTYLQIGDTIKTKDYLKKAQETIEYKRKDPYKEYLNEIYQEDLDELKAVLENR